MPVSEPFVLPVRIYYEDTDCAGVVYYSNYLKYLERARTEVFRHLGFDTWLVERGVTFAVVRVELDYRKAAHFNDLLHVHTAIEQIRPASLIFHQEVVSADDPSYIYVTGRIRIACVDMDGIKTRAVPPPLRDALAGFALPSGD